MIASLLEEVEQVLAGDELEKEKKKGGRLQCPVQRNDVRVSGQRLVDVRLPRHRVRSTIGAHKAAEGTTYLGHLRRKRLLVEVCLAENLDGVVAPVIAPLARIHVARGAIHAPADAAVVARLVAREHLADEVDDSIRACAEPTDDLELARGVRLRAWGHSGCGHRHVGDRLALEEQARADEITRGEDVFGEGRGALRGGGGGCGARLAGGEVDVELEVGEGAACGAAGRCAAMGAAGDVDDWGAGERGRIEGG